MSKMRPDRAEILLNRINAALADLNRLAEETQKRLRKADRPTAARLQREALRLEQEIHALKADQKALKRDIIPRRLTESES